MDQEQKDDLTNFATLHDIYKREPAEIAKYQDARGPRDFWIVSHWPHHEHGAYNHAKAQVVSLKEQFPDREFRVYHCKKNMHRSQSRETILGLCDMIDALLAPHDRGHPIAVRMQRARKLVSHVRGIKQKSVRP